MDVRETVREKYGEAALRVKSGGSSCCGAAPGGLGCVDPITSNLYDGAQAGQIPEEALLASLGCGNPTALAELKPGETVLDLGSGEELTCCSLHGGSVLWGRLTDST
jgi:arsenite methyltransferase